MPNHPARVAAAPRLGLALGGGVARGWTHIGILRGLLAQGIEPSVVAGTSVGALVGGAWLAGRLDALEAWTRGLNRLKILGYLDLRLAQGGLIGGDRLVAEMRRHLGDVRIEQLPVPFAAVATDLVSGQEVWLRRGDLVAALRTSFSLPGVFPPVAVNGRWLIDGALVNPVPVSVCRALGADVVLSVNPSADTVGRMGRLDRPTPRAAGFDVLPYLERHAGRFSPLDGIARRLFRRDHDGPSLFGIMTGSLSIIMDRIARARLAGDPPDLQIEPRVGHIGLMEFDRAAELIEEGRAAVDRVAKPLHSLVCATGRNAYDTCRVGL